MPFTKASMPNPSSTPSEKPQLARALEKNDAVQDTVEKSAQELFVINKVLEKEIPASVKTGDVAMALVKTAELEDKIQESAEELAHVNELLQKEIAERAEVEQKLHTAETEIAKNSAEPGHQAH
jgi:C4-dicarboxylate-specific signal transduction histidine kinase